MFIEILIAILLGIIAGTFTGLTPGIHVNLVSLLLFAMSPALLQYTTPVALCVFIISMATTHSFLDFIPSVFLGAPSDDTALSILPGHRLFLQGKAFEAVKLTLIGSLGSLIMCILLIPFLLKIVEKAYPIVRNYIGWLLIFVVVYITLKDKQWYWSLLLFALSGALGLIVLNLPGLEDPLFPMLSGLFGLCMLITSLFDKIKIPKQEISETIVVDKVTTLRALAGATFAGFLTSFFPGLGAAQGAVIATELLDDIGDYGFMIVVGGINTVNFVLSLVTMLMLDKARSGAVVVMLKLLENVTMTDFIVFIASALVVGGIATILTLWMTRVFSSMINRINYKALVASIIVLIVALTFYFSGFLGLLVLITATFIGFIAGEAGIPRNNAMGCLMLPVILFFIL